MKKINKLFICFILLVGVFMSTFAAAGVFPYKVDTRVLDNGMKIIMIPLESPGLVAYYSIVRTGSRDEWEPGHSGFAHFFEHMMFRGTKKYPGPVYDRIMTEIGANTNAFTSDDLTAFYLIFNKDNLEKVIELEADRFQNLSYTEQAFKTEAGAVYGEYQKNLASPYSILFEKLMDTSFDIHTYKHTTMGFRKDIIAMPTMYEYSKSFFSRYYRPENVVLVITGDFNPEMTFQLIQQYYADWKSGYVRPNIVPEPEQKQERQAEVTFSGRTLPILTIAYKGPAFSVENKDVASCFILGNLAFGENSELYKKLVIQEQRVQYLSPGFDFHRDPKLLTIMSMVKKEEDVKAIQDEISLTVEKFQTTPVMMEKLEAEKNHARYSFLMNLDTPGKVADSLVRLIAITGGIKSVDGLYEIIESLSPEDIKSAAQKFLASRHRTIVVLRGGK
jgi:zinc protease